ncbi:MAG TPA: MbtH family NRPS accessory protein [Kofleriaceae bacterium]
MFDDEAAILKVVRSGKGRYSIWPVERDCPPGWQSAGFRGTRSDCLDWIRGVWVIG